MEVPKYELFTTEQFLNDDFFIEWVRDKTPESCRFWQSWMERNNSNLSAMLDAKFRLEQLFSSERYVMEDGEGKILWQRIEKKMDTSSFSFSKRMKYVGGIAAAIAVILGISFLLRLSNTGYQQAVDENIISLNDIYPGSDKAMLTLEDGRNVFLESIENEKVLDSEKGGAIRVGSGEISYKTESLRKSNSNRYNKITTPRGGQYKLVLADGSKVWLNAESSLRYPVSFNDRERRVELVGEGYFEIAHDADRPFFVETEKAEIKVLGTHFNVSAYKDQPKIEAALLEGKIEINTKDFNGQMVPGEVADIPVSGEQPEIKKVKDITAEASWKDGYFDFNGKSFGEAMKQIGRWYNIEITYQGGVPNIEFGGKIQRNIPFKSIVNILKLSNIKVELLSKNKILIKS